MHHRLGSASKGKGGAWGADEDSDSDFSPDPDSDTSLEGVICIKLLSLSPSSLDWGGRTTMA